MHRRMVREAIGSADAKPPAVARAKERSGRLLKSAGRHGRRGETRHSAFVTNGEGVTSGSSGSARESRLSSGKRERLSQRVPNFGKCDRSGMFFWTALRFLPI
jgi:hypothetical protein